MEVQKGNAVIIEDFSLIAEAWKEVLEGMGFNKILIFESEAGVFLGVEEIKLLKQGKDVERQGETIHAVDATETPLALRKYSFITDTKPKTAYYEAIKDSDLLYHESTFMGDAAVRAADTFHTTNLQAAEIALKTKCKKLVLGHFSTRYTQLEPIKVEAQTVFKNTELAIEGTTFKIEH